jgi:hypothetical protein
MGIYGVQEGRKKGGNGGLRAKWCWEAHSGTHMGRPCSTANTLDWLTDLSGKPPRPNVAQRVSDGYAILSKRK